MQGNDNIKIFLKNDAFLIPFDKLSLNDVSQEILTTLKTKQQYEVKSNVSKEIFQLFINNWINGSTPDLNENNIDQFDQLSKEFDRMKDLIQIYNKYRPNKNTSILINKNDKLKKILFQQKSVFQSKTIKYNQIIEFLFKNKGIDSNSIFMRVKNKLFKACIDDDLNMVDFLTRKRIKVNDISYLLNENDKTASVYKNKNANGDIFIPRDIEHESQKYTITSVFKGAFKNSEQIQSIQFSEDSELISIGDESFSNTKITKIQIPQKVTTIGPYAFSDSSLNEIEFSVNSNLKKINESAFAYSLINSIVIPASVERIETYGFYWCQNLNHIEFPNGSKLTYIGQYAFAETALDSISIPSNVTLIESCSFLNCHSLRRIEFSNNSKLKSIEKESFTNSALESISLPSSMVEFKEGFCSLCSRLNNIEIIECEEKNISLYNQKFILAKSDRKSDIFDILVFARRNIKYTTIPSFITRIITYAFNNCMSLNTVEFEINSKLKTIEKHAFSNSTITKITIPSNVTTICEYAFNRCSQLQKVDFSENSKLTTISMTSFGASKIESIIIPSSVEYIGDFAFSNCNSLQILGIQENSRINSINSKIFSGSKTVIIMIPVILKNIVLKD